jgi:DNA-binding GntR family transcriptional regulator
MQRPGSSLVTRLLGSETSLADRVHATLREQIVDGSLPAGTRLREPVIAVELGVSRTPVREALGRLLQEGLAVRYRGGGLHVAGLTRKDAAEIIGIRAVLEGYAARLAAERITPAELDRAKAAHAAAAEAIDRDDIDGVMEANTVFHDTINGASHSTRCVSMISELRDWVLKYRAQVLADEASRRWSFEQHAEIIAALEQHDEEAVEALTRRHILETTRSVLDHVAPD